METESREEVELERRAAILAGEIAERDHLRALEVVDTEIRAATEAVETSSRAWHAALDRLAVLEKTSLPLTHSFNAERERRLAFLKETAPPPIARFVEAAAKVLRELESRFGAALDNGMPHRERVALNSQIQALRSAIEEANGLALSCATEDDAVKRIVTLKKALPVAVA